VSAYNCVRAHFDVERSLIYHFCLWLARDKRHIAQEAKELHASDVDHAVTGLTQLFSSESDSSLPAEVILPASNGCIAVFELYVQSVDRAGRN
jgi:hypothetical protein